MFLDVLLPRTQKRSEIIMTILLTSDQVARGPSYGQLRRYFSTARERYNIYLDRIVKESPPWTDDPIFQRYKFCNVFREHDKVTVWLRENWREPYADHPNLPFAMALARLINWPPTLKEIGFPKRWNPKKALDVLYQRKLKGNKVYTGAYLLGSCPKGTERANYLINSVLSPLKDELLQSYPCIGQPQFDPTYLESTWRWFRSQRGIGDFLAYEIVSDLRHTKCLRDAPDIMTWANAGPGALRGLTRLWGYQPKTRQISGYSFPKKNALEAMQALLTRSRETTRWGLTQSWEMRDVEHWLCEYDKYCRIMNGQGVLERFVPKNPNEW